MHPLSISSNSTTSSFSSGIKQTPISELTLKIDAVSSIIKIYEEYVNVEELGLQFNFEKSELMPSNNSHENTSNTHYYSAYCFQEGLNVKKDPEKVIYHLKAAAKLKHEKAILAIAPYATKIFDLAKGYSLGITLENNDQKAFKLYKKAANLGHVQAICDLGMCLLTGKGVEVDVKSALSFLQKAAEKDSSVAHYRLARIYGSPKFEKANPELSLHHLNMAAEKNHPSAYTTLARLAIGRSKKEAIAAIPSGTQEDGVLSNKKSLASNSSEGQISHLDVVQKSTNETDVNNSPSPTYNSIGIAEAIAHYKKAIELGCTVAIKECLQKQYIPDLENFILMHAKGETLQDIFQFLKTAVEQNRSFAISRLIKLDREINTTGLLNKNLINYFSNFENYNLRKKIMFDCFKIAADRGNMYAQFELARIYLNDHRVDNNYLIAAHYFGLASNQGHSDAQNSLATLYNAGTGVVQSFEMAAIFWESAASVNHPTALFRLGICYLLGTGVEANLDTAIDLFIQATNLGDPNAYAYLMHGVWQLSTEQIQRCPKIQHIRKF